ncbi:MAG: EamA family transporter RarD [Rhodocyclaceae bacterium]|nr:EamA family transporter RarD [Rhodocyclaceae bacterium]
MTHSAPSHVAERRQIRHGTLAGIGTYIIWGVVPIFFKQIDTIPAGEVIAHRVVWSLLLMAIYLWLTQGFAVVKTVLREPRQMARIAIASLLVGTNWLIFVYGVNQGRILETSLGYFILPLLNVALGVMVLNEKLRRLQWLAVTLAAIGVTIEAIRVGGLPWISLTLAATFGFYGLMRKQLPLDSANGLFLETACMTPLALGYLLWLSFNGQSHFGVSTQVDLMLAATGVVTAIPLLLFAIAARRLPLSTIGFLQYLAPTISFMIAIFLYHEPMNVHRALGFAMIWTALIVYSIDMLRARR